MYSTILSSTNSGKSNYHIGEIWHVGNKDYEIISWFERKGERYYVGAVKDFSGYEFYHVLYNYKGIWRRYS